MEALSNVDLELIKLALVSHVQHTGYKDESLRLQAIKNLFTRILVEQDKRKPKNEDDGFYVAASDAAA